MMKLPTAYFKNNINSTKLRRTSVSILSSLHTALLSHASAAVLPVVTTPQFPFCNTSLGLEARLDDLVKRVQLADAGPQLTARQSPQYGSPKHVTCPCPETGPTSLSPSPRIPPPPPQRAFGGRGGDGQGMHTDECMQRVSYAYCALRPRLDSLGLPSYYWGTNAIHGMQNVNCLVRGWPKRCFPSC